MPPKKATGAKPEKTAAAAPHASYKVKLHPDFYPHHAVAGLRGWVFLGRVLLLTCFTRHDQGSYLGCEFSPSGAFGVAARRMPSYHATKKFPPPRILLLYESMIS